ncbi:UxaA family hydrolase [Garciella nitratireducens]|uniref:UxaA family hydrolase n=1 Tax=Garciella nitratireducens TaxID=218205 RepID=UPI001BD4F0E5|nr:UxaA family hydrolase [Garciella nitratireducens]
MKIKAYKRSDGSYGIRNKILILSTVGCANETARMIANQVKGAEFVSNTKGCGQIGNSLNIMRRSLIGLILNPNVYGAIIVGLGCETMQPHKLYEEIKVKSDKSLEVITIQKEGGTVKTVAKGVKLAQKMVKDMSKQKREETDLSNIVLATNCGGSDATSGLAANPSLGYCSDLLVKEGGTVILGETTELIGTEHILARRVKDEQVREKLLKIIRGLEEDFIHLGIDVRGANPTPGNMKGGLSTLEEKALGGISKGGSTTITEVVRYGEVPTSHGLVIMDTPGYDIESITGMAAGGAQVCIFTTGRGTPIGNPIIPVIKVTGNRHTYKNMKDHIDIDTSGVIHGGKGIQNCGEEIMEKLIHICNGHPTKAELYGFSEISVYRNNEIWCSYI